MENNEKKKKAVEMAKVRAGMEVLEASLSSGVQPTTISAARSALSDFLADEEPRRLRGGACYLCGFESRYYEVLTGSQAKERFINEHQQQRPTCPGEFASYGGLDEAL